MPAEHAAETDRTRDRAAIDQPVDGLGRTGQHVGHVCGGEHDGGRVVTARAGFVTNLAAMAGTILGVGTSVYCNHPSESFHSGLGFEGLPGTRMKVHDRAYTSPIWYTPAK